MIRHTDPIYGNAMTVLVEVILKCPARWNSFFFQRHRFSLQFLIFTLWFWFWFTSMHRIPMHFGSMGKQVKATQKKNTSSLTEYGINIRRMVKWNKASMICFYCSLDELWNGSNEKWKANSKNITQKNSTVFFCCCCLSVSVLSYRMCLIRHECH